MSERWVAGSGALLDGPVAPESSGLVVVPSDPWLDGLQAASRASAVAYVALTDALLGLLASTPAPRVRGGVSAESQALAEAGAALGLHPQTVAVRLTEAQEMRLHPQVRELLLTGGLGVAHAIAALDELRVLADDDLAARVLARVLGVDGWSGTPGDLRRALRTLAIRLDPVAAQRRRLEQTAARTGVRLHAAEDGLAEWCATGPAVVLTAADRILDVLSAPTGPDDDRTRGQRQLDALIGALAARAGSAVGVEMQLELPCEVSDTVPLAGVALPEPVVIRVPVSADLLAVLGDPTPRVPAPAPVDPFLTPTVDALGRRTGWVGRGRRAGDRTDLLMDLAQRDRDAQERYHRQFEDAADNDPWGPEAAERERVMGLDTVMSFAEHQARRAAMRWPTWRPPPWWDDTAPYVEPDPDEAPPPPPAPAPPPAVLPQEQAPAELLGHGPLDPGALLDLLTDTPLPTGLSGVRIRRVLVDPSGQVVAADTRTRPLPRPDQIRQPAHPNESLANKPSNPVTGSTTDSGTDHADTDHADTDHADTDHADTDHADTERVAALAVLDQLLTDPPQPPPATDAYRPTAAQQRVVRLRDPHCTFPACRRTRADLDHLRAHPDGPTSTVNLHPLCRHHHRLKQEGWTPTRHADGTTTWTSPRGQSA